MPEYDPVEVMRDLRDALVASAHVVTDNFGKSLRDLNPEYKPGSSTSVRTVIDTYAQAAMKAHLQGLPYSSDIVFNLEEDDVDDEAQMAGKLLVFGDPFDGTANAQPRLPLSTQGLMAAEGDEFIAAACLHPFEKCVLYGTADGKVYRSRLVQDSQGRFYPIEGTEVELPHLADTYAELLAKRHMLMPYIDAYFTPLNFCGERKAQWTALAMETFSDGWGGRFHVNMFPRMMGSNIDACMKLAEGRLHVQLTDAVGGTYDVAANEVFLPALGGVMTDLDGNPLRVPKTPAEMKRPSQQILVASIHPDLHGDALAVSRRCYGPDAEVFVPRLGKTVRVGSYPGFATWDPEQKAIFDRVRSES